MKILKDITDAEFVARFKSSNADDKVVMKVMFREWLQNRPHLEAEGELDHAFRKLASDVLPEIVAVTVKSKNDLNDKSIKVRGKNVFEKMPYLIREPNSEVIKGMIRFSSVEKNDKDDSYTCDVMDLIPFEYEEKPEVFFKLNNEKMQMFSIVYKNHDAWRELDTDGDFADNEELRKAVVHVAKNGIGLNIEHQSTAPITNDDAMIIEFYQSRSNFYEDGLEVRKGDLVATTQFFDTDKGNALWNGLKDKEFTTYSMEGVSE